MFTHAPWLAGLQPAAFVATAGAVAARQRAAQRQDALLDEALKETFPASHPVSVARIG